MILREYQKIAKRWGREKKEMEHGPVENHEKNSLPLFILGRKSRTGSWGGGAVVECGCCEGKEDRGDLTRVKGPGMGQLMLVVGMCTLLRLLRRRGLDDARLF